MDKFQELLDLGLSNLDKIRADAKGVKGRQTSWFLDRIHKYYPNLKDCFSAATCLSDLVDDLINTKEDVVNLLPKVKTLLDAMSVSKNTQSQTYTRINNQFKGTPFLMK